MNYATEQAAKAAANELNGHYGFPPARVYKVAAGGFMVIRRWLARGRITDPFGSYVLLTGERAV